MANKKRYCVHCPLSTFHHCVACPLHLILVMLLPLFHVPLSLFHVPLTLACAPHSCHAPHTLPCALHSCMCTSLLHAPLSPMCPPHLPCALHSHPCCGTGGGCAWPHKSRPCGHTAGGVHPSHCAEAEAPTGHRHMSVVHRDQLCTEIAGSIIFGAQIKQQLAIQALV